MAYISILSPIKNEENVLQELVNRVTKVMNKNYGSKWELILVNDASNDNSEKIMKQLLKKNKNLVIFNHEKSRGQTGCFKTGFDNAKGDIIVTIDGDLQLLPEDIPKFIDKVNNGYDVVNAIREHRKHPFWIKLASRIYNILMLILFDSPVMDAASNFTAFRAKFVKNLPLRNNDHRYIIPIAMRRGAKKIGEIIVEHKTRQSGKSKYSALPKYLKGLPEIIINWFRIKMGFYDSK